MNKENIINLKRKITNKWFETKDAMLDEILNVIDYLQHQSEEKNKVIDEAVEEIKYLISNCDISDYQGKKIIQILERGKK